MKKFLLIILSILLLMSMMSVSAYAEEPGTPGAAGSLRGAPGETVYLTVNATESIEATALAVKITVPEELTFVQEESKWLVPKLDGEEAPQVKVDFNEVDATSAVIVVNQAWYFGGDLLVMAYRIPEDAQEGTAYPVEVFFEAEAEGFEAIQYNTAIVVDSSARELTLSHYVAELDLCAEKTLVLTAEITPANTKDILSWSSGKEEVATVEDGTVTAWKKGETIITATVGGLSEECQIIVTCSHNLELVEAKDSTCTEMGNNAYYSCAVCSGVYTDAEATNATSVEAQSLKTVDHNYEWVVDQEPTEAGAGVKHEECTVCHTKRSENTPIAPLEHTHKNLTLTAAVEATCTSAGNKAYYTCSCGEVFADAEAKNPTSVAAQTIPQKDHDYQWIVDKDATESASGLKHEECTVCHAKRSENTVIDKLPHTHKNLTLTAAVEATCTSSGNKAYYTCGCGKVFADAEAKNPTSVAAQTVAKKEHNYTWIVDQAATESASGLKHEECTVCGAKRNENTVIEQLGHTHGKITGYKAVAATCTKTGTVAYWTCGESQCDGMYYGDENCATKLSTILVPVDPKNHVKTEVRNKVAATWYAEGYSGDTYCADCGSLISEGKKLDKSGNQPANPFVDVAKDQYYYTPVLWAVEKQITNGVSADAFGPDADCTRGHVVTFLWRAAGSPEPSGNAHSFTDISANDYFYKAVLWAVEKGITNGTSATTFSPDAVCTRAQVVTFLHRYAQTPAPGSQSHSFDDISKGAFYYDAVLWAAEQNITTGVSANAFAPDGKCNRGQIVTFLFRFVNGN